jgi:preprotein translocase subunit SecA
MVHVFEINELSQRNVYPVPGKIALMDIVDTQWKDHLLTLGHLKEGIGLRGYGQKDPLVEFKKETFTLFEVEGARGQRQNAVT